MAFRVIAHRGASAAAPENTLAAFALARDLRADAIELDARICGTGEIVVFHDRTLVRLTGEHGLVERTPLAQLRELRVLGREPIPTLAEALAFAGRPKGIVVELKSERRDPWESGRLARKAAAVIRRHAGRRSGGGADGAALVVSSFDPTLLFALRRRAPELRRALLVARRSARPWRNMWLRGLAAPAELHLEADLCEPARLAAAHARSRPVVAWTVNERAAGERLLAGGVAGLITDRPELFT